MSTSRSRLPNGCSCNADILARYRLLQTVPSHTLMLDSALPCKLEWGKCSNWLLLQYRLCRVSGCIHDQPVKRGQRSEQLLVKCRLNGVSGCIYDQRLLHQLTLDSNLPRQWQWSKCSEWLLIQRRLCRASSGIHKQHQSFPYQLPLSSNLSSQGRCQRISWRMFIDAGYAHATALTTT